MLFFLHKCFIYDKDAGKQIRFNEKRYFIAFVCMNIGFVQEQSITQEQANNLNPSFLPNAKAQRHKVIDNSVLVIIINVVMLV